MPPRIPLRSTALQQSTLNLTSSSIPVFLLPFLSQPASKCRQASILSDLRDTPGSYNKAIRRGRGPSSGKGKTSGRGQKGQKAKSTVPKQLTGGQTPDHVVHGHYGFKNVHAEEMSPINLDTIQSWIDAGRLQPHSPITLRELCASRALHGIKDGVKLLARGSTALTTPIHIVVSRASKSAIAAVEALGGSVVTRYYTPQAIRRIKAREMHPYVSLQWDQAQLAKPAFTVRGADSPEQRVKGVGYDYRLPDPVSRKDLEYYRDQNNRGYLSHQVAEGHSASLWYESAPEAAERKAKIAAERAARGATTGGRSLLGRDNKMW